MRKTTVPLENDDVRDIITKDELVFEVGCHSDGVLAVAVREIEDAPPPMAL